MTELVIDLSTLGDAGFIIQGDAAGDGAGNSVSSAGDVNGDGIDDLIIGALYAGGAGKAYVIFGKEGGRTGNLDLSALGGDGFVINGDAEGDYTGYTVSSAGDVNGDGIDDLIVGAPNGDDGGDDAGEAYVIFGKQGATRASIELSALGGDGFIIQGDAAGDRIGYSVSSAGDINGDGIDDLIVGAPRGDDGGADAGEAYVIFGKEGATRGNIDLSALGADGFVIQGDAEGDYAGTSVSAAGDINGDGIDDLIVGAPSGDDGGGDAGEAYVIFGKQGAARASIDLAALGGGGFIIQGDAAGDAAGFNVSAAGDVNGDGIDDLIVGAIVGDDGGEDAGEAYVIFGKEGPTRGTIDLSALGGDGFIIQGDAAGDFAGGNVSAAGDINDDGIDDLIVGALFGDDGGDDAGEAYVIFGKEGATRGNIDLSALGGDGFIIQGDAAGDLAGYSVSAAGDINGDGIDDLIVGAPFASDDGEDTGAAYVIFGQGPPPGDDWRLFGSDGFKGGIGGSGAVFGTSALQDIAVLDVPGDIGLDPSFNRGGDILRLPGDAAEWQVSRLGSSAVFSDGDTFVTVPVGTAGLAVVFDDGARNLKFDAVLGNVSIGGQSFATTPVTIAAAADGTVLPPGVDSGASSRLFMASGVEVVANGKISIFGTAGVEQITLAAGDVSLDPSFNRGGDTLILEQEAADFTAVRIGSSVFLDGSVTDVIIPAGTAGMNLSFAGGDDRILRFDTELAGIVIGTQSIDVTPAPLTDFA